MRPLQGGNGGRIVNIASMAGLATGLGTINDVGYTAAKHGVVALTRSFDTSKPSVEATEGVKLMLFVHILQIQIWLKR